MYPDSFNNLIESFKTLPGIGAKTAERLAFSVIELEKEQAKLTKKQTEEITKSTTIGRPPVGDDIENDNTAISIDQGNNVSDIKD